MLLVKKGGDNDDTVKGIMIMLSPILIPLAIGLGAAAIGLGIGLSPILVPGEHYYKKYKKNKKLEEEKKFREEFLKDKNDLRLLLKNIKNTILKPDGFRINIDREEFSKALESLNDLDEKIKERYNLDSIKDIYSELNKYKDGINDLMAKYDENGKLIITNKIRAVKNAVGVSKFLIKNRPAPSYNSLYKSSDSLNEFVGLNPHEQLLYIGHRFNTDVNFKHFFNRYYRIIRFPTNEEISYVNYNPKDNNTINKLFNDFNNIDTKTFVNDYLNKIILENINFRNYFYIVYNTTYQHRTGGKRYHKTKRIIRKKNKKQTRTSK